MNQTCWHKEINLSLVVVLGLFTVHYPLDARGTSASILSYLAILGQNDTQSAHSLHTVCTQSAHSLAYMIVLIINKYYTVQK